MNAQSKFKNLKIVGFSNLLALVVAIASGIASLPVTAVAAPSPAPVVAVGAASDAGVAPKSVFIDRADFGRDPFFPKSERRGRVVVTNLVASPINFTGGLALKGISGTLDKRLAIINNKTFEVGEEAEIRVHGQYIKVKCTEIREKSAVVLVNGVSKELFLGPRL